MATTTRRKGTAATIDQIPAGLPVKENQGRGAIVEGVKGFVATSGVGSDDTHSYTIRLEPSMSSEIQGLTAVENAPKASVVRGLLRLGLAAKNLGISLEDLEQLKK